MVLVVLKSLKIIEIKKSLRMPRDLTHHVEYIRKKICLETIKLIAYEVRNLNKTWQVS